MPFQLVLGKEINGFHWFRWVLGHASTREARLLVQKVTLCLVGWLSELSVRSALQWGRVYPLFWSGQVAREPQNIGADSPPFLAW